MSDSEVLIHLEKDRPQDLYFIDRSNHEMGVAEFQQLRIEVAEKTTLLEIGGRLSVTFSP